MMKKNNLGKGLGVLFQGNALLDDAAPPLMENAVLELPLGNIDPNREQPRKRFDEEALRQLAESIRQSGVIQPIIVYPDGSRYTIVAGERRWRAARIAGLEVIPAIVRDYDRVKQLEVALVENIQREDLNPLEEAAAVTRLMDECGLTQEGVSQRIGRSRPAVANLLRLLSLPEPVQELVRGGSLTAGHARALAGIDDTAYQRALAESAVRQGWSVRQMEAAVQRPVRRPPARHETPVELSDLEESLRRVLGMRASVVGSQSKGRIVLTYGSMEELENLLAMLQRVLER
ncbi:MAG: ParB/RepB/Spo0J family partition protein [Clostridia bacterium]|nr:ParB/RepB/Spo0J family partition protein [Clostridia bacterium]